MTEHGTTDSPRDLLQALERLARSLGRDQGRLWRGDTLEDEIAEEFFWNNWEEAQEELLFKTDRLRVHPFGPPPPRSFRFEYDRRYLRQAERGGPLSVAEGPITGKIFYRSDLFTMGQPRELPTVAVLLDGHLQMYHPNVSWGEAQREAHVCLDLPAGAVPLEALLQYLTTVLSYQIYRCSSPLNREAARALAVRPEEILGGLPPAGPLY
jgi:hypothetical protein